MMKIPMNIVVFNNPRRSARIENWPHGWVKKATAIYEIESNKKGERVIRTTTGKPKKTGYYKKVCLVDGNDGKLYIIADTEFGMLYIIKGTLNESISVFREGDTKRYKELKELLEASEILNND